MSKSKPAVPGAPVAAPAAPPEPPAPPPPPPDPVDQFKELLRNVETKAYAAGYTKAMRIIVLSISQLDAENRAKLAKAIEDLEDEAKKLAAS